MVRCGLDTSNIGRDFPFDLAVVGNVNEIAGDLIDALSGIMTQERIKNIKSERFPAVEA